MAVPDLGSGCRDFQASIDVKCSASMRPVGAKHTSCRSAVIGWCIARRAIAYITELEMS